VIRKHAEQKDLTPAAVEHVQCYQNGVSGLFENNDVKIGSKDFVGQYLQNTTPIPSIESKSETIQSTVYMSCGERLCALFLFGDTLRPGASATVAALRDKGYNLALVSGDGEQTTRTIGNMLGIENATGDQQPQDKAFYVQNRQKQGQRVAMVGDGVNDAPALVQSDLAVAVHSGSHLGKEAADITLMRGSPEQILDYLIWPNW
jgi:P-type E1-E2 ATPase